MAIVRYQQLLPSHIVHGDQVVDRLFKGPESLIVVQISDVLTDKRLSINGQCDRGFLGQRLVPESGAWLAASRLLRERIRVLGEGSLDRKPRRVLQNRRRGAR